MDVTEIKANEGNDQKLLNGIEKKQKSDGEMTESVDTPQLEYFTE